MKNRGALPIFGLVCFFAITHGVPHGAKSCEFCVLHDNSFTLAIENADVAVIGMGTKDGLCTVKQILKGDLIQVGIQIKVKGASQGNLWLVTGNKTENSIDWNVSFQLSRYSRAYLDRALRFQVEGSNRLSVIYPFLNDSEPYVADDAFRHFSKADDATLRAFKGQMDAELVIQFVTAPDDQISPPALRELGLRMLGICGKPEDAKYPFAIMTDESAPSRRDLDKVIGCYLTLAGEPGLQKVRELFVEPQNAAYPLRRAAIHAMAAQLQGGALPKPIVLQQLHHLLSNQEVVDEVIGIMIEIEDWSAVDQIAKLFRENEARWLRVVFAKYFIACPNDDAKATLEALREVDPKAVLQAETGKVVLEQDGQQATQSRLKNRLLASWLTSPWLLALLAGCMITVLLYFAIRVGTRRKRLQKPSSDA